MTAASERDNASDARTSRKLAFAVAIAVGAASPLARARGIDNYPEVAALVIGSSTAAVAGVGSPWTPRGLAVKVVSFAVAIAVLAQSYQMGFLQPVVVAGLSGAVAAGALIRWQPLPGRRQRTDAVTMLAVGPIVAAGVTWWRSASVPLVAIFCVLAVAVLELAIWTPSVVRSTDRRIGSFATGVAELIARTLAVAAWAVFVLPTWAFSRLTDYDQLDPGWERTDSAWVPRSTGRPAARRLGSDEMATAAPVRLRLIVRNVLVVLLIGMIVVPLLLTNDPTSASQAADTFDLRRRSATPGEPADIADADLEWNGLPVDSYAHEDEPWIGDFFRELLGVQNVPDLILGGRNGDFAGKYLNVRDGRRASYSAPNANLVVWFFGGSTMYGIGQRDDNTLPSVVAHLAEADGLRLQTVNFGVSGDVNWQETVRLMEALQSDLPRPDLVVFYDGVNDRGLASQRIDAGSTNPAVNERFPASEAERQLQAKAIDANAVLPFGPVRDNAEIELAATQYRRGVDTARRLAEAGDFEVTHFWQPQPFAKKAWPADDELYRRLGFEPALLPGSTRTYAEIRSRSGADPIDLTTALDDIDVPVYFDSSHTNELGARVVGTALYEQLRPRLERLGGSSR